MLGLTAGEAARTLRGRLCGDAARPLRGVRSDSRAVQPGDLFVALPGARTDGHVFLEDVQARGAVAALALPGRGGRPAGLTVIEVPDVLAALGELARFHLGRLRARVYGVTGTVGKTTAKDLLAQMLGGAPLGVHAAPASFNSEVGVPLSVLGAPLGCRALVLEYGVNAPGEMERLLAIARPHESWITALTEVHLEGMGDLRTIVREKALLAAAAPASGRVWLGSMVRAQLATLAPDWAAPVCALPGLGERGLRARSRKPLAWRLAHPRWGELRLPMVAEHEVEIALAAAEIAAAAGAEPGEIVERLQRLERPQGRLTVHRYGGVTVLDDAYNSSPASARAALSTLAAWPGAGRRLAVLGTMHELGAASERLHRDLGRAAAAWTFERLIGVGAGGAWIADSARAAGLAASACADPAAAAAALCADLRAGDVVLLKASRAERLDHMLEPLGRAAARGRATARAAGGT